MSSGNDTLIYAAGLRAPTMDSRTSRHTHAAYMNEGTMLVYKLRSFGFGHERTGDIIT